MKSPFRKDLRFSRRWFLSYLQIVLGSIVMAGGYVLFIVPYRIVPGGVYGVSIVAHYLFGLPTGTTALVLNIPLLWWGIRELGPRFGAKTMVGLVLTSGFIDLLTLWWGEQPATADPLVSSIFGGVLIGAGLGLIFRSRATSGGSDIVAQILTKRTRVPVGQMLMVVDAAVVGVGIAAFHDITLALYALVTIFVTGKVIDAVVVGMRYYKTAMIISAEHDRIRDRIINSMGRGGTYLLAKGMYNNAPKKVIFCAVSRRELPELEMHVREVDPTAFMTVFDTREVLGEGFLSLEHEAAAD